MTHSIVFNPRRMKALIYKESAQIIRDPSSILICFVLPLLLMFIYGYGVSLDMNHLRVGLVLEDTSPNAQSFAQSFIDSPFFETHIARDRRFFIEEITRGTIRGIVVIPSYFSTFNHRPNDPAPIQVIADGSEPNTANFVQNYAQGAWVNWLAQENISRGTSQSSPINIQPRFWYNEELESKNFLIPGSLAIIMTLIGTLLTALVVSREWERGTMEALMSTPVNMLELLTGKIIPYFFLGMISMSLCVIIATLYYHIPFRGSFIVLGFVSSIFLLTALGLGLLISTIAKNQFVAAQSAMVAAFLPGFILSGFIFEIASMPLPIKIFTHVIPARYFVSSLQTLFLVGNVWPLIISDSIAMIIIGSVFYTIISFRMNKRLD
ncbi:MAG: ABC transporter permease [Parachlamydiaceae bacterium]|nr:ABC transporter permease [Parachlamydiaceae bacterium]